MWNFCYLTRSADIPKYYLLILLTENASHTVYPFSIQKIEWQLKLPGTPSCWIFPPELKWSITVVAKFVRNWHFRVAADQTYDPKASVFDESGNEPQKSTFHTNWTFEAHFVSILWDEVSLNRQEISFVLNFTMSTKAVKSLSPWILRANRFNRT